LEQAQAMLDTLDDAIGVFLTSGFDVFETEPTKEALEGSNGRLPLPDDPHHSP